jgi:predicted metalloprotease with PDZ domain
LPPRLLIVSAGDPMWRGGLSGPASVFVHSDRPLISENRTSTLLHELVHVALGIRGDEESDWIVEGLAEYYSLETLRRSGSISAQRHKEALHRLGRWAQRSTTLFAKNSTGATTARAVMALRAADAEIRGATGGKASLDDVARKLAGERGMVSLVRLQKAAQEVAGRPLHSLEREQLSKSIAGPTVRDG